MTSPFHPQPKRLPSGWIGWVDDIRGVLTLYVVMHHAALAIDHSGVRDGLWSWLHGLLGWGHFRVDTFFVLSGFCLAQPIKNGKPIGNLSTFLLRRTVRLLPPYYIACLLSLACIHFWLGVPSGTQWDVGLPVTVGGVLSHIFMVHQWWHRFAVQINYPLWSIGVEYQLYFLFPILIWVCQRMGALRGLASACVLSYGAWWVFQRFDILNPSAYGSSVYYVALFTMGVAAALMKGWRQVLGSREGMTAMAGVTAIMTIWAMVQLCRQGFVDLQVQTFFVGLLAMTGLLFGDRWSRSAGAPLSSLRGALRFVGERSFSVYLVHAPVLQLVWLFIVRRLHLASSGSQILALLLFGLPLTLLGSAAFHRLVDMPFHRLSRRLSTPSRHLTNHSEALVA